MGTVAVCNNCKGTGEIDSGAPDPQGHFIDTLCPVCMGIGKLNLETAQHDADCCGIRIYIIDDKHTSLAVAVDPDWKIIVDSDSDEHVLCKRICATYW